MNHRLPRCAALIAILALALAQMACSGLAHRSISAKDVARTKKPKSPPPYRPPFSQIEFLLEWPPDALAWPPPEFVRSPQYAFPGGKQPSPVSVLEGQRYYDLRKPPRKGGLWWRVPLYLVTGLPRDLVDGAAGRLASIPILGFAVGAGYEFSGAQFLMRHPNDVHLYGGYANENGHGWIGGNDWGYFSNRRNAGFGSVDTERLRAMEEHNKALDRALAEKNTALEAANAQANQSAKAYLDQGLADFQAGHYADALARCWNYSLQRPNDFRARAHYLACCVEYAYTSGEAARWSDQEIRRLLASWPQGNYAALLEVMRALAVQRPEDLNARYWLAVVCANIGDWTGALTEGQALLRHRLTGVREASLYFEICLRRLQKSTPGKDDKTIADLLDRMREAAGFMRGIDPYSPEARLAVGRLNVMTGQYAQGIAELEALAAERAGEAKYAYFAGAGLMLEGLFSSHYDRSRAVERLKRAKLLAQTPLWESTIDEALRQARKVKSSPKPRVPEISN